MKKTFTFLKTYKVIIILCVATFLAFKAFGNKETNDQYYKVEKGDFVKSISISGKVASTEESKLAFETVGTISSVYKNVGDKVFKDEILVALDSTELQADLAKAKADLLTSVAELSKVKNNKVDDTEVLNNKREIVNGILNAYTKADDAIRNKTDQYFRSPSSSSFGIKYTFEDYFDKKYKINESRSNLEYRLDDWKELIDGLDVNNYSDDVLKKTENYLITVKNFLDDVAPAVNTFEVTSDLSQATIDKYRGDLSIARFNINESISNLIKLNSAYQVSFDGRNTTSSDVPVLEAKIKSSEASVQSIQAKISKLYLRAPFAGVVSLQEAKVGQAVSLGTDLTSIIAENYRIDAYIPEVSIPGISIKNKATVTLDAYNDVEFEAVVTHIDPAETLKDGVSNYKIELSFLKSDSKIKPGMTADIKIDTQKLEDVISIPERTTAQIGNETSVYLRVVDSQKGEERKIKTGERDGKGNVLVKEGLSGGEEIFLDPSKNI